MTAPVGLLHWLIENCTPPPTEAAFGSGATRDRRLALLNRDAAAAAEARRALQQSGTARSCTPSRARANQTFTSRPTIEVVVIEGKRTEPGPTTSTTWMPVRHQMLRHIDAAWDTRGTRRVIGLMIVEAAEGSTAVPAP